MSAASKVITPTLINNADTITASLSQARSIAHVLSICPEAPIDVQQAAWAIRCLVDAARDAHDEIWRVITGETK